MMRARNIILVVASGLAGGVVGVLMSLGLFYVSSKKFFLDSAEKHGISEKTSSRFGGPLLLLGVLFFALAQIVVGVNSHAANQNELSQYFQGYLIVALLAGVLGFSEDYSERLSPRLRLQALALIVTFYFIVNAATLPSDVFPAAMPQWLNHPFVIGLGMTICVVGFINAGNVADGANGLLSVIAFVVFLVGYLETGSALHFALLLSTLVFSIFNMVTGSIFLGDSGAYFLSALMALICVEIYTQGNSTVWYFACLVSYPCVELVRVMCTRWMRGVSLLVADNAHVHNMLFDRLKKNGFPSLLANTCTGLTLAVLSTVVALTSYLFDIIALDSSVWLWIFALHFAFHLLLARYLDPAR